jgi:hypothetical protein
MVRGAKQRGNDRSDHRRVEAIFRWEAGDGGEGDALGQHDDGTGEAGGEVGTQGLGIDLTHPAQEGENTQQPGLQHLSRKSSL